MLSLRKINPMARAVGTMGIVATMVGAVTFANLTSNVVALDPNNIDVASASLVIDNNGSCADNSPTTVTGLQSTNLAPGGSVTKNFCIRNTGEVPLAIGGTVAEAVAGTLALSTAAQATTLTIQCGTDGPVSGALNTSWTTVFPTALAPATTELCTATAALSSGFGGSGGDVIPQFAIKFSGTSL